MSIVLTTTGFFRFPCQPDGWCTYGCGTTPESLCLECYANEANFHPIIGVEGEPTSVCDKCEEFF